MRFGSNLINETKKSKLKILILIFSFYGTERIFFICTSFVRQSKRFQNSQQYGFPFEVVSDFFAPFVLLIFCRPFLKVERMKNMNSGFARLGQQKVFIRKSYECSQKKLKIYKFLIFANFLISKMSTKCLLNVYKMSTKTNSKG